jgi:uncharacterized protein YcbK (DUF882 family)
MRSPLPFVVAASLALACPLLASAAVPASHHHHARHRIAASSHCGATAGHASHTVLASPAAVNCSSSHRGRRTASVKSHARTRSASIKTLPQETQAKIQPLRRVRFVPPLRGSLASLMRQNRRNEAEGLVRIEDDEQLEQLETARDIVPLPASASLRVNPDLPANRRYCRPWTARFLANLGQAHFARFHRALQVNSAVRTVDFQRALIAVNDNAAPAEGDIASPHLTGAAVDIGKKGLSLSEISWLRAWLLPLQTAGKIDVEEEFYQACFHITVYRSYAPPSAPKLTAHRHHTSSTLLATGVQ